MSNYNNATKNPPWQQQQTHSNMGLNLQGQQQSVLNTGLLQYPQNALLQAQQLIQQNTTSSLMYGNTVTPNQQQQYANTATANTGYNHMAAASNVTYPTRHLNSTAFATSTPNVLNPVVTGQGILGTAQVPQGQGLLGTSPATFPKQRVFTGTVTKRQDNFGFVDEDVFFQVDVCKGSNPRLGDKVLVEAAYNPSMPFKWNATRIQVLPMDKNKNQGLGYNRFSNGSSRYSPPGNDDYKRRNNTGGDSNRRTMGFNNRRSSPERSTTSDRKRRFDDTSSRSARSPKKEDKEKERERSVGKDSVSTRKSRSISPKRRRVRPVPRYSVTVPKFALDLPQADLLELRRRYQNMYIPSDFFISSSVWLEAFPPDRPFSLQHPCSFHILSKEVEPYLPNTAELDPPDVDYLFSAKVMLLSMPKLEEVLKKCVTLGEDLDKDQRSCVHPSRLINFLVGMRGKSETMAIGGPWSESLDGPNPDKDPSVLIKTAIRTTKALTGIDLSKCTKWFKFLELYYRRGETTHKGKPVAARVETVVIYVPDVWNCVPTQLEWDGLTVNYQKMFTAKISKPVEETASKLTEDDKDTTMDVDTSVVKREPTHYSLLDIKNMKVQDLREELEARSLSSKGLKSQLTARLAKALKTEQSEDDAKGEIEEEEEKEEEKREDKKDEKKEDGDKKEGDDEKKDEELTEKEKQRLEKKYTLPEAPSILVHPSTTAKSSKFSCEVMSLSLLLDYRIDDAKEHSFEVACFAELFNEMLMRDFGFQIFKAIHNAPEPVKEEKETKKEKSKKEDDKSTAEDEDKEEKEDDKEDEEESEKSETRDSENKEKDGDKKDKEGEKKSSVKKEKDEKKEGAKKDDKKDKDEKKSERDRKRSDDREKRREKEKEKVYTENAFLLLCCVYFDTTHIGYMYDKDLEDLLLTLGLSLSRSQVKKLVQKVLSRDTFFYRKLTDKPQVEGTERTTSTEIKLDIELLKQLIEGNKKFLPVFTDPSSAGKSPRKGKGSTVAGENQLVMYQGSLVDIGNMQAALEKSDSARVETEKVLMKLRTEHASLEKSAAKLKEKLAATASALETTSAELKETQTRRAAATETKEELFKVVEAIYKLSAEVVQKEEVKKEETEKKTDESEVTEAKEEGEEEKEEEEEKVHVKQEEDEEMDE